LKPKTPVGIEISDSDINVATIRRKAEGFAIEKWGSSELPEGTVQEGLIIEKGKFAAALRRLLAESRIRAREAVVSISAPAVMTRLLRLPLMEPEETREAIAAEVGKYVAFAGEETIFDFLPLEVTRQAEEIQDILVSVTTKDIAFACADAVSAAGLQIRAIETSFLASVRAAYGLLAPEAEGASIFVHLGAAATDVSVIEEARIILCRRIPIGAPGIAKAPEELSGEIKKVVSFYRSRPTPREKLKLIISPADAGTEDLARRIAESTPHLEIELFDISERYGAGKAKKDKPSLPAVGSAMRELEGVALPVEMNLLPEEVVEEKRINREILVTLDIVAILFVASFLGFRALRSRVSDFTSNISAINQQLEVSANLRSELERLNLQISGLASKKAIYEKAAKKMKGVSWSGLLLELSRVIPKDVRVVRLSENGRGRMTLEGEAISYESVSRFVKMLEESELVESAQLSLAEKGPKGLIDYSITCTLKTGER